MKTFEALKLVGHQVEEEVRVPSECTPVEATVPERAVGFLLRHGEVGTPTIAVLCAGRRRWLLLVNRRSYLPSDRVTLPQPGWFTVACRPLRGARLLDSDSLLPEVGLASAVAFASHSGSNRNRLRILVLHATRNSKQPASKPRRRP